MKTTIREVAIIGLGPAGVCAAIYLKRFGINPICFEKSEVASKLNKTEWIENYPGFIGDGPKLAALFKSHVEANEIEIVKSLVLTVMKEDDVFKIQAEDGFYYAKSVIVATGIREKEFRINGEADFSSRGISRCAICDGPLYKKKEVAVYGNRSAALEEANYLASISLHVYLIADNLDAPVQLVEEFKNRSNTTLLTPFHILSAHGEKSLDYLTLENIDGTEKKDLFVKGLFLYVGNASSTTFLPFPEIFTSAGFIKTNDDMSTEIEGLYAIGDIRVTPLRQIVTAASDGAVCALTVKNHLSRKANG